MQTLTRPKVDAEEFWINKRVPRAYIKLFIYVFQFQTVHGRGPAWRDIAGAMGWDDLPRDAWRNKIRRARKYGLKFKPGVPGSTRIAARVIPHVEQKSKEGW